MAVHGVTDPFMPAGSSNVHSIQHPIKLEHGLETPQGTATSPVSGTSAPHTPHELSVAQVTELPTSSVSSNGSDSARDHQKSRRSKSNNDGSRHDETSSDSSNDPFLNSGDEQSSEEIAYRPRPDRFGTEITAELAQAIFPSDACVFVANLVASKNDDEIRDAVKEAFSPFGSCYVKVKRDSGGMPYAFVQYEKVEDSGQAIMKGRHLNILGRPCRTERAKVNRSLYLSRTTGGRISEAEAREILADQGDIQSVWYSTPTDIEMFRLPQGIWVQFAFFQDARDAASTFKESTEFRLEQPQLPEDLRAKLTNNRIHASHASHASHAGLATPYKTPLRQGPFNTPASRSSCNHDATSIFISNLNGNVTLDQLRAIFGKFGSIRNIDIVCRPGVAGNNVHAFVDFDSPRAAMLALDAEHVLGNTHLRVERRQSTPFSMSLSSSSRFSNGSPRNRSYARSNSTMPSTPFSGGHYPPEFGYRGHMGEPYPMHIGMHPFCPPYGPNPHANQPPMHLQSQPMIYGSPASGHFHGDHGFGQLPYHPAAPPQFALPPQMPPMPTSQADTKNGLLPTLHEHLGQ